MAEDIYVSLRDKLDTIGFGYTPTDSGIEFTFLERFFTPKEAEYFIAMDTNRYLTATELASSSGKDINEVRKTLKSMSERGLLFRTYDEAGEALYRVVPVAHGIFEFHVNQIEPEWSSAITQHYMQGWGKAQYGTETPILRTIPLNKEVVMGSKVLPVDDVGDIIRSKKIFAVAACICRKREHERGKPCKHNVETCLVFDDFAKYYLENELAREIDVQTALKIVEQSAKDGCVIQVANAKEVEVLCCCCSCACALLGAMKYFPGPGNKNVGNYYCVRTPDLCRDNCNHLCATRCPMGAFKSKDEELTYNREKCIGCGLCVPTCPGKALKLQMKDDSELYTPQGETLFDTYNIISKERGVAI